MSSAVEEAAATLAGEVRFELLLGGVNVHAVHPLGEFGRRHLMRLWREVAETTGQSFGFRIPDGFVYNSWVPCVALEAVRRRSGAPPFGFLHRLQQGFFFEGRNIVDPIVLDSLAREFGWQAGALADELADPGLQETVRSQFNSSRLYGTNALPNALIETPSGRRLLFGGYADAPMIVDLIRQAIGEQ